METRKSIQWIVQVNFSENNLTMYISDMTGEKATDRFFLISENAREYAQKYSAKVTAEVAARRYLTTVNRYTTSCKIFSVEVFERVTELQTVMLT